MRAPSMPGPERDLSTRADVHDLVVEFYREIVLDDLLAPLFDEVAEVDWTLHIPRLVDYWSWILLGEDRSIGSVTGAHRHLHRLSPIGADHCDRWYALWTRCIDSGWSGPGAERARTHAATLMAGMARHVFGCEWSAPALSRG